jgi:uncharacterized protein (DUF302 family)/uncharacterized membrane protein YidH (DUF202 family)
MSGTSAEQSRKDLNPADYLAAERTFLAWIRTGLALMGFGFVVARFGLFLQQLRVVEPGFHAQSYGLSIWFGTALIAAGVIVDLFASWHHLWLVRELHHGEIGFTRPSRGAILLASFLAIVGIAMAVYLILGVSGDAANRLPSSTLHPEGTMTSASDQGIVSQPSNHSVDETVVRLKALLQSKGVTLFAVVDHSGEAGKAGLKMPPTKLLIFGNPKGGTPVMLASPSIAIDLPLKILVAEDANGRAWVSYNSPAYLKQRHHVPDALVPNIAVAEMFAEKAAE